MPKLPAIGGMDAVKAFEAVGFRVRRITGSHHVMSRSGHRFNLSVPVHKDETIPAGTLGKLIKLAGLTKKQFVELLR